MVQEKVLGKTHPETLMTIVSMAIVYEDGLEDSTTAEETHRLALDGHEKSLGKDHKDTNNCACGLGILLARKMKDKEKTRALVAEYPHLMHASYFVTSLESCWVEGFACYITQHNHFFFIHPSKLFDF